MKLETVRAFLGWCTLVNFGFLAIWFIGFSLARDRIQALHGRWFRLGDESFDAAHYNGMAYFKMAVILFNLTPYLVLRMVEF